MISSYSYLRNFGRGYHFRSCIYYILAFLLDRLSAVTLSKLQGVVT